MSIYGHRHIAVAAVVASLAGVMWMVGVLVRRRDKREAA